RVIRLRPDQVRPASWAAGLVGQFVGTSLVDPALLVSGEDVDVFVPDGTPDGRLLVRYRVGVLPPDLLTAAYPALARAAPPTLNRGDAAGGRWRPPDKDGRPGRTSYARPVLSGVMGYLDPSPRNPLCRATMYTRDDVEGWEDSQPLIRAVAGLYRGLVPDR